MSSKEIKRNRSKSTMKTVREELFEWLCKKHATNNFLDRHALREKALELTRIRGFNGFKCSEVWLTHFLKQHGFRSNQINQGNPKFADYRDWIRLMRPTITKYRYKDLFHVDELMMHSDIPPSNLKSKEEDDSEEPQRNRISVLMGCDASGTTKLPLLVCGPYPSRITAKEHVYSHSEDSRISDELFRDWLTSVDDRMVRCKRKILLFLKRSRARALQDFVASNVRLIYLPDNFPPHLRPLRRDVFHYVKMVLRRRYAELLKITEEWGLREILTSLIEAWETIPRELLIFSFQRTHFRIDDSFLQIDCDCWNSLKAGVSFKKFVTFDDRLSDESYEDDRLSNEYRLRDVVQIHEDTTDSVAEDGREVEGVPQLSIESDWDCRLRPAQVQSQYQLAGKSVTHNYEKRNSRKRRLAECSIEEGSGEQEKPKKRSCATQCSTKRRRRNPKGIDSARKIGPLTSLKGGAFKENASQRHREPNEAQESLQAVMDKALHLLMSEKAKYVRNLIESMYVDSTGNVNSPERSNRLSVGDTDPSGARSGENEEASFSADQPSVSTVPTTEVNQNEFNVAVESPTSKITSPKVVEKNPEGCQSLHVNQNDEGSSSSVDDDVSSLSTKRRRRGSKELDAYEDDYQNSEPRQKKSKVDHDWSKKYENTFVFGSADVNCSSTVQRDGGIVDSCIINVTPRD